MTDHTDPASEEPTAEVPVPVLPTPPAAGAGAPPLPPVPAPPRPRGPSLGHIVLGAVLVLIGIGWLLEALDVVDVPWRLFLPSVLILVGLALTLGARTGHHGGLMAVGIVLTVLVLMAGAIEMVADVPLAGGIGDNLQTPTGAVAQAYRWGVGKTTLDLTVTDPANLLGHEVAVSLVVGDLIVIVPEGLPLEIKASAGLGDVNVLDQQAGGVDPDLACAGTTPDLTCGADRPNPERALGLTLEVGVGKVTVEVEEGQR
jgi:hypothetical protein